MRVSVGTFRHGSLKINLNLQVFLPQSFTKIHWTYKLQQIKFLEHMSNAKANLAS